MAQVNKPAVGGRSGFLPMVLLLLAGAAPGPAGLRAQESVELPGPAEIPAALSFFAPLVFPLKIVQDEAVLRDYVAGGDFAAVRRRVGDRRSVDHLFRRALQLSWNNTGEALAISLLATLEHRTVGVSLPVLGPVLWLPLTGEFEEDFQRRVAALPAQLYPDTPPGGDRDKLQHFFASALLTLVSESSEVSEAVGLFVEQGEEKFIVGGTSDARDVRANREGQRFALALMTDLTALPSAWMTGEEQGIGTKEDP